MFKHQFLAIVLILVSLNMSGQEVAKVVTLAEVDVSAVSDSFDAQGFINVVNNDTTFYLAFKAMNYYPARYKGWLKVFKKREKEKGEIERKAQRHKENNMMWVTIEEEKVSGKIKRKNGEFNYKTAETWNEVFFPKKKRFVTLYSKKEFDKEKGQSAAEKHRLEIKQMVFNPGNEVEGVPLVGNKMGIFEPEMQPYYNFSVYPGKYKDSIDCWIFEAEVKPDYRKGKTVIKSLVTYFDKQNYNVMKRVYAIEYYSIPLDFNIEVEVENQYFNGVLLPENIRYNGFFNIPFMKKEMIEFELYDFDYLF